MVELACSHTQITQMHNQGVLLAPAARPPATAPPRSIRSCRRRPQVAPAPSQRPAAAPCS
eukprot:scaffold48299_cov24-Phaeocystis_antarctica.AAC.1